MKTCSSPIALTMGEPAGISAEITLKAWRDHHGRLQPFFVIDDPERIREISLSLGWKIDIGVIDKPDETFNYFSKCLPVLPLGKRVRSTITQPDPANGTAVISSITKAATLALSGKVGAVVTNPIQKSVLYSMGFSFPGHTEYLAHLANVNSKPIMMLYSEKLRVVPVTRHVSLMEAVRLLSPKLIIETAETTLSALKKDFGISRPKLAIAGLNPHAGEDGTMGQEENMIIEPAVKTLNIMGYDTYGPLPADTLFHSEARNKYDAVLCMYHDQALIPIKTLDFERAVNVTLGLPFIRTSPDHGTALDISGTGTAQETSLVAAIQLASQMLKNRAEKHYKVVN